MRTAVALWQALLSLPLLAYLHGSAAQNVHPTKLVGQPLMYMKEGSVVGCGIRTVGGQPAGYGPIWKWVDASVNVYVGGGGLVKMISYDENVERMNAGIREKPKPLRVQSGWFKAQGARATTPFEGAVGRAGDGESLIYGTDLATSLAVVKGYLKKETISIGVRRQSETTEAIYAGVIEMTDKEDTQFRQCFRELTQHWRESGLLK